jgi:DNA-binding CsgD family transcriptional regulator
VSRAKARDGQSFEVIPNPWGISPVGSATLDAYIKTGSYAEVAKTFGIKYHTVSTRVERALEKIDGECALHKLIHWRDFRGLVPPLVIDSGDILLFGVTPKQARHLDAAASGKTFERIASESGETSRQVYDSIRRAFRKIPAEHDGQRLAVWRRARQAQKEQP